MLRVLNLIAAFFFFATAISAIAATAPTSPVIVSVADYSDTASEIFWSRSSDDDRVIGYEIRLDGLLVDTRDATSFFREGLDPNSVTLVSITAIDNTGMRSSASTYRLSPGNRGSGPLMPDDSIKLPPPAPSGARLEVYSATAYEVFWNRPADNLQVVATEIRRAGELVGVTDGTSFFFENITETDAVHELVAINSNGIRSEPTVVHTEFPDSSARPLRPINLRVDEYSFTESELFWGHPDSGTPIVASEVKLDGVVLGTVEGTSYYFTDHLGAYPLFEVTAIDTDGRRSDAASLGGPPRGESPSDALVRLDALLPRLFRSINSLEFEYAEAVASELLDVLEANGNLAPTGLTIVSDDGSTRRFTCAVDGSLDYERLEGGGRATARNCMYGNWVYDGQFARYTEPGVDIFDSVGLEMKSGSRTISMTADSYFSSSEDGSLKRRGWFVDAYQESDRTGNIQSQRAVLTLQRTGIGSEALTRLAGSGTLFDGALSAPTTSIRFNVDFDVRGDEGFYYPRGRATFSLPSQGGIHAPAMILRADNGDASTYNINVRSDPSNINIEETLITRAWSETVGLRCDVAVRGGLLDYGCF
ncbi:MAG: hypothetical protein KTR18_12800 [Acidiferrobacterales bacterium]|nr:hypothetical protein [Acidiferrobacterales bacterium]